MSGIMCPQNSDVEVLALGPWNVSLLGNIGSLQTEGFRMVKAEMGRAPEAGEHQGLHQSTRAGREAGASPAPRPGLLTSRATRQCFGVV